MRTKHTFLILLLLLLTLLTCSCGDSNKPSETTPSETTPPATTPCEHTYGEWETLVAATCKDAGKSVRLCAKCGATDEKSLPKTNEHTPVTDPAVPATCKATGLSEGSHCALCSTVLVAQTSTPKTNEHTPITDPAVPATCKDTGLTEGSHCALCSTVLVAQTSTPKTNEHHYVTTKVRASKTEQGYMLHQCDVCSDSYKDGFYDYAGTETLLYTKNSDTTCLVTGISDPSESCIDIPEKSPEGYTVVGIGAYAFSGNLNITSVSAPETVKLVGERAFDGCYKLLTAYIPGVSTIEAHAFGSCSVLKSVIYSDALNQIGEKAFYACKALKECRAYSSEHNLDTVTIFGHYAFAMSGITNPTFSANLTSVSLANQPFYNCKSLGRVDLSAATLSDLGGGFAHTGFTEFIFPKGITEISRSCFASCSFRSMTIPDTVSCIRSNAFSSAYFTKITLGSGLLTIEMNAFERVFECEIDTSKATKLESVGYRAFADSEITSIMLPASVKSIGAEAFSGCTMLKVLGIPFFSCTPENQNSSTNCFGAIFKSGVEHGSQSKYIPASLKTVIITCDEVEIERSDFTRMTLNALVLPKSFTCEPDALSFTLRTIYYLGTEDEFPDISTVSGYNKPTVYYYAENKPEAAGKYWHYVNGLPTAW